MVGSTTIGPPSDKTGQDWYKIVYYKNLYTKNTRYVRVPLHVPPYRKWYTCMSHQPIRRLPGNLKQIDQEPHNTHAGRDPSRLTGKMSAGFPAKIHIVLYTVQYRYCTVGSAGTGVADTFIWELGSVCLVDSKSCKPFFYNLKTGQLNGRFLADNFLSKQMV